MTLWNEPIGKSPWYHKIWAKPLNWVFIKIANGLNKLTELIKAGD
jgi:hypothetical protein